MGLLVTVNSDDPPLFNTTLSQEYLLLAEQFGYDQAGLARIGRNAFASAGVEEPVKRRLWRNSTPGPPSHST
jgi:aminodeoxyfutalosine deaminase